MYTYIYSYNSNTYKKIQIKKRITFPIIYFKAKVKKIHVCVYTGTQRSLEKLPSAKLRQPVSPTKFGSQPENEEELQESTTVTVEESVEFPVTLSKAPSVMTASSLEKSRRSSTMKWSAPPAVLLSVE